LVISLKSIAICLKENVEAVAFISAFKTAAKVLYRKRFDKKIMRIYFVNFILFEAALPPFFHLSSHYPRYMVASSTRAKRLPKESGLARTIRLAFVIREDENPF
jgi:hypothetical protein